MDKIALTNVRVFDGERLLEPATVVIDGDRIGEDQAGARTWEGDGGVLLPGLIDCHIHLTDESTLAALAAHGVTTALDMGTDSPELVASLRNRPGVTDVRSSGSSATSPTSAHAKRMGRSAGLVADPDEARAYVSRRVAEDVARHAPGTPGGRIPGAPGSGGLIVIAATAITNVRVFDGERRREPATVVLEDATISARTSADSEGVGRGRGSAAGHALGQGAAGDHRPLQQPRLRRQSQRAYLAARTVAHDLRSLRSQSARRLPAERWPTKPSPGRPSRLARPSPRSTPRSSARSQG